MQNVRIKRSELIEVLTKNRETHQTEHKEAVELYRAAAIKELESMLQEAKDGKEVRHHLHLPLPVDHTEDYDRELRMLSMSVDDVIELNTHHFDTFVMDNWDWKQNVASTMAFYKSAK